MFIVYFVYIYFVRLKRSLHGAQLPGENAHLTMSNPASSTRGSNVDSIEVDTVADVHVSASNHNSPHSETVSETLRRNVHTIENSVRHVANAAGRIDDLPDQQGQGFQLGSCGLANSHKSWLAQQKRTFDNFHVRARALLEAADLPDEYVRILCDDLNQALVTTEPDLEHLITHLKDKKRIHAIECVDKYWAAFFLPLRDTLEKVLQRRHQRQTGTRPKTRPPPAPFAAQLGAPPPFTRDQEVRHPLRSPTGRELEEVRQQLANLQHEHNTYKQQAEQRLQQARTQPREEQVEREWHTRRQELDQAWEQLRRRAENLQDWHDRLQTIEIESHEKTPPRRRTRADSTNTQNNAGEHSQTLTTAQRLQRFADPTNTCFSPGEYRRPPSPNTNQRRLPRGFDPRRPPPNNNNGNNATAQHPLPHVLAHNPVFHRFAPYLNDYAPTPQANPYTIGMPNTPDDYYRALTPPWNMVPDPNASRINDIRKLEGLAPKFDGKHESYLLWRDVFIPCVHVTNAPVPWKANILLKSLDSRNGRLKDIIGGLDSSEAGYAKAIKRLENAYGHPLGLHGHRLKELERVRFVPFGDPRMLEKLYIKLDDYIQELEKQHHMNDIFSNKFYEDVYIMLDRRLGRQFLNWHTQNAPGTTPHAVALLAWLEEIVENNKADFRMHAGRGSRSRDQHANREEQRVHHTRDSSTDSKNSDTSQESVQLSPTTAQAFHAAADPNVCPLDQENHRLVKCPQFLALSPGDRRQRLREWKRCYACFEVGHQLNDCTKGIICSQCDKNHHTLLHNSRPPRRRNEHNSRPSKDKQKAQQHQQRAYTTHHANEHDTSSISSQEAFSAKTEKKKKISLQTLPVTCANPNNGKKVQLNCMIDSGATGAFISKRAAQELRLTGHACLTKVTGFNGASSLQQIVVSHIRITAPDAPSFHITVQVTQDPAASYQPFDWCRVQNQFAHLSDLPLRSPVPNRPVDIMLGQDTPELLRALEPDRTGDAPGQPVARKTPLGWTVGGPTGTNTSPNNAAAFHVFTTHAAWQPLETNTTAVAFTDKKTTREKKATIPPETKSADKALTEAVLRMYQIDDAAGDNPTSQRDEAIFRLLRGAMIKVGSRYQLPVLWKQKTVTLNNNFPQAAKRLKTLKFANASIATQYHNQIDDWIKHDFVEEVMTSTPNTDKAYYLPHFPVIREDKTSSQIRPVMDAAARHAGNPSLNDQVHKGPKLINELVEVLLRFRRHTIAFSADIEKMFHKITMPEEDRDYHRFLWNKGPGTPTKIYRWKSHVFGNAGSPCVAIFAVKEHARRHKLEFPQAADTVIFSTLVDDNLDSRHTVKEAQETLDQLREMLALMDMNIKKVTSNSEQLLKNVPANEISPSIPIATFCTAGLPHQKVVKALGVIYLAKDDAFSFALQPPDQSQAWTKRLILRYQARLYDPHGLILPITIAARMILQEAWRTALEWDDVLTLDLRKKWQEWLDQLPLLPLLRIPRCLHAPHRGHPQQQKLHIFADASAAGYAAVAYVVTEYGDGEPPHATLALSKGRVAPLRQVSIPRLELLAAELAIDLAYTINAASAIHIKDTHFWTDSTNVLCWLKNDSRVLNSFVGTRVAKIQHHTIIKNWSWIPGNQNPADLPSRGTLAGDLALSRLWWEGPAFLTGLENIPEQPEILQHTETAVKEVKKGAQFAFTNIDQTDLPVSARTKDGPLPPDDYPVDFTRFSSFERLRRVVAWCKRVFQRNRRGPLTQQDLKEAERIILIRVQNVSFQRTLTEIRLHNQLPRWTQSTLRQLTPQLHPDGLLRAHARLRHAQNLHYDARFPIILPKNNHVTTLLIDQTHQQQLHAGLSHVLTILLRKYWIVQARSQVKQVLHHCIPCKRQRPKPLQQIMAPLPDIRLPPKDSVRPFQATGIDMAGPYHTSNNRKITINKRYFVIFTCLATRALHLEPVATASAASFIAAFQRFLARRRGGDPPDTAVCDNGSNLTAAAKEITGLWNRANREQIQQKFIQTNWTFIPPLASHYGGVYERLIAAVKTSLYHAMPQENPLTDEEFSTALTTVECILNSRPLTYVADDPEAPLPLTPADALGITPYHQVAPTPPKGWSLQKRWHFLQHCLDKFWERFRLEVLPYLQRATKWTKTHRDLQKGDVVLQLDDQARGKWPLALVDAIEPGRDGHVRAVHLRCPGNPVPTIKRRPITKVALLLPIDQIHTQK